MQSASSSNLWSSLVGFAVIVRSCSWKWPSSDPSTGLTSQAMALGGFLWTSALEEERRKRKYAKNLAFGYKTPTGNARRSWQRCSVSPIVTIDELVLWLSQPGIFLLLLSL